MTPTSMTRSSWLRSRRLISERLYDTVFAATYDRDDAATSPVHLQFVADLAGQVPIGGSVLDAPCGTGKYFGPILEAGRNVVGCDQSAGGGHNARREYHYYPSLPQVRDWMSASGFTTIDEAHSDGAHVSYSYQHFHARR